MSRVRFRVRLSLRASADALWRELVDWQGHGRWIPATTVVVHSGDGGVGTEFTATSGLGPFQLPDRMRVVELDGEAMRAEVLKLSPAITGPARFSLRPTDRGTSLLWEEDVEVRALPEALAPVAGWLGALLFTAAITRLDWQLRRSAAN